MHALEFHHLDEHQVHEIRVSLHRLHHALDGVSHQLLKVIAPCLKDQREHLVIGMKSQENRFEDRLLAAEVVVQPTQGEVGSPGNLAHRGAVVALGNEQVVCGLQDGGNHHRPDSQRQAKHRHARRAHLDDGGHGCG